VALVFGESEAIEEIAAPDERHVPKARDRPRIGLDRHVGRQREGKPSERFVAAMKKIISVPKEELKRREAEYQQSRKNEKKRAHH
jgi:hypothetical protein